MKKLCTKILVAAIVLLTSSSAFAGRCWVTIDGDSETDNSSVRQIIESVMKDKTLGCDILEDDYADNSVAWNSIVFQTAETAPTGNVVDHIQLNKEYGPLYLSNRGTLLIGNYSEESISSITDEAEYNHDDSGYVKNDDGTVFDYGYVIIDNQSFLAVAEGESVSADNLADMLPFTCKDGAADVYLRNMIFVVPAGVKSSDVMNLACIKDGGDVHFCDGSLNKDLDGKYIDPNSGADWCNESTPTDGDCDDDDKIRVFEDSDSDGYGCISRQRSGNLGLTPARSVSSMFSCESQEICPNEATPTGFATEAGDCNDNKAEINPNASEGTTCDNIDNDCDGDIDEGLDCTEPTDADGDGYTSDEDCNDADNTIYPGATEICGDSIDQDCDGSDLACTGTTETECADSLDNDADGAIDCSDSDCTSNDACSGAIDNDGDGFTEDAGDCNDADAAINPAATEICDQVDNDCDTETDEGLDCTEVTDEDGDGYDTETDCNDTDASINPGATEVCFDEIDQDCDSVADEGCSPEVCDDTIDNDLDGIVDCEDTDCDTYYLCNNVGPEEECSDTLDNDGDEAADCEDADCTDDLACTTTLSENCNDGVDNNLDGLEDCEDPTCSDFDLGDGTTCADAQVTPISGDYAMNGGGGCGCDLTAAGAVAANPAQIIAGLMTFLSMLGLRARAKE